MKYFALFVVVLGVSLAPIHAQDPITYEVTSGITSISLFEDILAGLGLTNATPTPLGNGSTNPQFGFDIGYVVTPATDMLMQFSGIPDINGISPLQSITGSLRHSGGLNVDMGASSLALGNFSISFDASRQLGGSLSSGATSFPFRSGLTLTDNLDLPGTVLFDLGLDGDPNSEKAELSLNPPLAYYAVADLLVSPELADLLGDPSAAGTSVGIIRIDMGVAQVPEPAGALLVGAFAFLAILRRCRCA